MFTQLMVGERLVTPRVRLYEPFEMMKRLYGAQYEVFDKEFTPRVDSELFFVRARCMSDDVAMGISNAKALRHHKYLVIAEMDDSPELWKKFDETSHIDFRGVCAVTCSTEALADKLRVYNPHVKVLKNQIAELLPEKNFVDNGYVNIFFGALNRGDCWQDIMPALNKLAKKYKDKLRFTVLSDYKFFESLQTEYKRFGYDKRMNTKEFVPYIVYMEQLYRSDIALLPLKDTSFNRAKSDLKFIESANAQVAVLASPTVYEGSVKDGETGFIYRSPREFQAKLEILIKNRAKRIEMSKAAYEYVKRERMLIDNVKERYDWMREMYAKREELYDELFKRCEGL